MRVADILEGRCDSVQSAACGGARVGNAWDTNDSLMYAQSLAAVSLLADSTLVDGFCVLVFIQRVARARWQVAARTRLAAQPGSVATSDTGRWNNSNPKPCPTSHSKLAR
jgi:hypothetical protein